MVNVVPLTSKANKNGNQTGDTILTLSFSGKAEKKQTNGQRTQNRNTYLVDIL